MNIIQQQEALKDLSDQQIAKQMQQPSGEMPLYLVSSEAKRRADLRDRYKTEASGPPPTTTVQEDLLRSVMSSEMAPSGIAQNIPQPPPTQAAQSAPQMPPQMPPQQQGIMQGAPSMPPQGLPGNSGAPRGFAMGGQVRGFAEGGWPGMIPMATGAVGRYIDSVSDNTAESVAEKRARFRAKAGTGSLPAKYLLQDTGVTTRPRIDMEDPGGFPPGPQVSEGPPVYEEFTGPSNSAMLPPPQNYNATMDDAGLVMPPQSGITSGVAPGTQGRTAVVPSFQGTGQGGAAASSPTARAMASGPMGAYSYKDSAKAKTDALMKQDDPYADIATKLKARDEAIAAQEQQDIWLAVARGGFGAAAGESQHALTNIAGGGLQGMDALAASKTASQASRDKNLALQNELIGNQQSLKADYRKEGHLAAQGELAGEQYNTETVRNKRLDASAARQRGFDNQFAVSKLNAMLQDKSLDRGNTFDIAKMGDDTRKAVSNLPPPLLRALQGVAAMEEGETKDWMRGVVDGSSKRDSAALVRSSTEFSDMYQKYVTDNGPPDAAGWKLLKEAFAADPNAQLFEMFAMGVRGNIGQKPNLADQWEIKDGVRVRKQT